MLNEDKQGVLFVFFSPFETFASHYAIKQRGMRGTFAKCFKLNEFVSTIANKLLANSVSDALVFPVSNGFGLNVPLTRLIADIHKELENYE